ncbi:NAD(P)H-binding protein [Planobispora siamensis]|uniref:Nucleotide-diphosphate-sugar epimerase n=1 Tax=Planobispora siamensis TaxID=936338 RepID=A0A8J3SD34_9ACTN|nr:NAD(P)H-binding protein [Planobispora siamensis]GIH89634.1 nucleotide-diphosphate-sugar epimerase [Planobispora siamensis]
MTILVTGATGTVGRHVVDHLLHAGLPVRALTRDPAKADLPREVEVVGGDLAVTDSLTAAMEGVTAVHLINFGGDDYAPLPNGREIVQLAAKSGVRRATVLGGRADGSMEEALAGGEVEWTLLNPVEFMANTLTWWAESVRAEAVVREPFGGRLSAMIHEADIGAVAATILGRGGHGGRTYVLTGPEALTTVRKVEILGEAVGREIRFVELTEEQARDKWRSEGMGEEFIEFLVTALGSTPEEGYTVVPTVEQITGRAPRTFARWAAEHADAFRP